jgi:P2X purinoceptor 4
MTSDDVTAAAGTSSSSSLCARIVDSVLEYETPKVVHISNKTVGFINRSIQLIVVAYIALYVIWWEKGYQEFDAAVSASTTKLKGISLTNFSDLNISIHGGFDGLRLWDVADYVVPPQENDAFFLTTNIVITPQQKQGKCPEDPTVYQAQCTDDSQCQFGTPFATGNGVKTGKCVQSDQNKTVKTCEIFAWCPVEVDQLPIEGKAMLADSKDFTVLIKNYVEFPKFQVKRNILDKQTKQYLRTCRYNRSDEFDKYCPIISIGTIVREAGVLNYEDIAVYGGVIVINIDWNCNLDLNVENCLPEYSFSRLDNADARIAKGANFRYSSMYENNGTLYRDLFKAYGIRFLMKLTGKAGKFNIVPLLLNVGSGIGLLAIASVICDIMVLYVMKKRHVYKKKKYLYVDGEADNQPGHMDDECPCVRDRMARENSTKHRKSTTTHDDDDDDDRLLVS